ncbi:MAG: NlpC/P60 family protein [Sulfurovum sp.]|nr:NlpC/P60 family protein [Sulfurovum sp.]
MLVSTTKLSAITILLLSMQGCKPPHHPSNPNYAIVKPTVKHKPSTKSLEKMVKNLQGRPYVWAEEGPNYFDCSGYTYYMYGSMGIEIPRVARDQAKKGKKIQRDELIYGDLIFFDTEKRRRGRITHVGMYLGDGWFTHASTSSYEIVYSNLNTSAYYKKRLRICRRYLPQSQNTFLKDTRQKPWKTKESIKIKSVPTVTPKILFEDINKHTTGNFYVQVGSFTGNPKKELLYKITQAGYHYKIIKFPLNGQFISQLLIGPYLQREKAVTLLPIVKEKIHKDAFIAEIR